MGFKCLFGCFIRCRCASPYFNRLKMKEGVLHPEEGRYPPLTERVWNSLLNADGQVKDEALLRKLVFFGGLEKRLRREVWPFLLHCYSYQSTYEERDHVREIRKMEYAEIEYRRQNLSDAEKEEFLRTIQSIVDKDVVRTDRTNPFYAGENNPHLDTMRNILLNYAVYNCSYGYTQGMSDLLAPILAEMRDEADAFWCFVGVMRKGLFVCTPTDSDMERNLGYLRELIRLLYPAFYEYLKRHPEGMDLLFCHRWLLLCFKREFPEEIALRMWEACWSNCLTDYFNLFLCLAIVVLYADDIINRDLRTDEMLFYFSSLTMYMNGNAVLRKARGLLYEFYNMSAVPCTVAALCRQHSGLSFYRMPEIQCVGVPNCQDFPCPHNKNKLF